MSLDGRFISFLAAELQEKIASGRIQKIYQLSKTDFLFVVRSERKTNQLYISLSTSHARLHLTESAYDKPETPSGFCMFLRKYLEGGIFAGIMSLEGDRIVQIMIRNHDDLGAETHYAMYLEIMGRYANLVIVDQNEQIIDAFQHVSPFEGQKRTIEKGARYLPPFDDKINPANAEEGMRFFRDNPDASPKAIIAAFRGVSPLLAGYLANPGLDVSLGDHYAAFLKRTPVPTLSINEDRQKFYYFDLFPAGEKVTYPSLSSLLDEVYRDIGRAERLRQISKNLLQFVKRELDKNIAKLEKLANDLARADSADHFRMQGDLLLQNLHDIKKGQSSYKAYSYEAMCDLEVAIDPLMTPIQNANSYYRRYRKLKASKPYIEEQVELTKKEIQYFSLIDVQIANASQIDIEEIAEELSSRGYTRKRLFRKKQKVPNYAVYLDKEGIEILVGKNNTQNEYITHTLARPEEWWFHTKDFPGSHVLVKNTEPLSETTIRTAAQLAAWNSVGRLSSSVPVDYTKKRFVKRIPGEAGCFVAYQNHKTIYIDPDGGFIASLTKKRN